MRVFLVSNSGSLITLRYGPTLCFFQDGLHGMRPPPFPLMPGALGFLLVPSGPTSVNITFSVIPKGPATQYCNLTWTGPPVCESAFTYFPPVSSIVTVPEVNLEAIQMQVDNFRSILPNDYASRTHCYRSFLSMICMQQMPYVCSTYGGYDNAVICYEDCVLALSTCQGSDSARAQEMCWLLAISTPCALPRPEAPMVPPIAPPVAPPVSPPLAPPIDAPATASGPPALLAPPTAAPAPVTVSAARGRSTSIVSVLILLVALLVGVSTN